MVKSDVVVHYLVYARQYHFKRIYKTTNKKQTERNNHNTFHDLVLPRLCD